MVGTHDALCVDRWAVGSGDTVGVCRAKVEVLKAINPLCCMYDIIRREKMVPLA